ncbi:MAG: hypothetical protein B7Z78_06270 [Rhodospirillales bacterium 20-60-12]|jgi:hypothetical protein|nr:MAG: hypothetical protein B7Z78_06270 [Rhodospirillales bacterium 20-60-12]HQT67700.1 hypothetical protein [Acetobacteraceae bacterium]
MRIKSLLTLTVLAGAVFGFSGTARADWDGWHRGPYWHGPYWHPGVIVRVGPPVYFRPRYYAPPVYYAPPPVYYAPRPVYVPPPPVFLGPPAVSFGLTLPIR